MAGAPAALRLTDVSKHFGGVEAMRHVDLTVEPGERVSVIGTNGAGKSTLFNCIAGALPITHGRVELFGVDVTTASAARRTRQGLARTFQTSKLFGELSAGENVYIALGGNEFRGRHLRPYRRDTVRWQRVGSLLDRAGLAHRAASPAGELSHGEQRQLELAMALALEPRLLMLDEPAAGFSPAERVGLIDLLRDLPQEVTLLLIEHDMEIALAVATRVVVMHDGEKILEGSPEDVRSSSRIREIYLGGAVGDVA